MDGIHTIEDLTSQSARAQTMRRAPFLFSRFEHVIPEEITDWRVSLERSYWRDMVGRLTGGDVIEVHTADCAIQYEIRIIEANGAADPPILDIGFRPLWPLDLDLPPAPPQLPARYAARLGPGGGWRVLDLQTGKPCHDNYLDKNGAQEMASRLERALQGSAEQVLRGFIRHQAQQADAAAEAQPAQSRAERNRERSRKWRAARRAAAAEAAAAEPSDAAA
jgi:hypothetical protein